MADYLYTIVSDRRCGFGWSGMFQAARVHQREPGRPLTGNKRENATDRHGVGRGEWRRESILGVVFVTPEKAGQRSETRDVVVYSLILAFGFGSLC